MRDPLRYFKTSPEVFRPAVTMYIRFPLSLRRVEDLLHERGIDISHETVRAWWNRFGPLFAAEINLKRSVSMRGLSQWRWHLDEVFVRAMAKFRSVKSLRKFASIHSSVYYPFDKERHLYNRENFELSRSAALAEWRRLAA